MSAHWEMTLEVHPRHGELTPFIISHHVALHAALRFCRDSTEKHLHVGCAKANLIQCTIPRCLPVIAPEEEHGDGVSCGEWNYGNVKRVFKSTASNWLRGQRRLRCYLKFCLNIFIPKHLTPNLFQRLPWLLWQCHCVGTALPCIHTTTQLTWYSGCKHC